MTLRKYVITTCLLVFQMYSFLNAQERTWTSSDGKNTIVAEMTRLDGETLYLHQSASGKNFKVDLSQMSTADGQYAREQAKLMSEEDSKTTETQIKERLWTSADGTQQIEAEFISVSGGDVHLKAANGVRVTFPLSKFSKADRDYIDSMTTAGSQDGNSFAAGSKKPARKKSMRKRSETVITDEPLETRHEPTEFDETDFSKFIKPDHQTLLKMYYASNGDVLKEDLSFAMEVYTTLDLPPLDPQKDGSFARLGYNDQWYNDSKEYSANEFTRNRIKQKIMAAAKTQLADSNAWTPTGVFRLQWAVRLKEYDFDNQRFPLLSTALNGLNYSSDYFAQDKIPVPRVHLSASARKEYGKQKAYAPIFRKNFLPSSLLPVSNIRKGWSTVFTLAVTGLDKLDHLPMSPAQAETLLKQLSTRSGGLSEERGVIIEGLVQVGPISIAEGKLQEVPTRILALRAVHPLTQQELHRFAVEPIADANAMASTTGLIDKNANERVPEMARMRMALLQFREHPELLNKERLAEWTRNQIVTEQNVWKQLDEVAQEFKLQQAGRSTAMNLNPKQPIYIYSWRDLQAQRKDLADGPLLEIFAGHDQAWTFLRKEPNWDDRFKASVAPFLFTKGQIVEQPVESAKVMLQPELLAFAKKVAEKVPDRLAIPVALRGVTLNSARTALVVDPSYSSQQSDGGKFNLLAPVFEPTVGEPKQKPGVGFPQSVKNKSLYQVRGFPESLTADKQIGDWLFSGNAGHNMGRAVRSFQSGATFLTDYPAAVALDREIVFDQIPLSTEIVKTLTDADYLQKHSGERAFEARIIVSEIKVDLATEFSYDGTKQPKGIIVGKVDGIRVLNRDGEPVAFIPASDLPKSKVNPDDNPFTSEPGESFPKTNRTASQDLTPAMIPLLIARYQPQFFESHLDQFTVSRLQHEYEFRKGTKISAGTAELLGNAQKTKYWFRKGTKNNTYGVDPALGEALPAFANMPDEDGRKKLATQFKTWIEKNKSIAAGPFTIRFADVEFKHAVFHTTPSPAFFHGMRYGSPFYGNPFNPIRDAENAYSSEASQVRNTELYVAATGTGAQTPRRAAAFAKEKDKVVAWGKAMTNPPREIYFSTGRFEYVVPDSNGNRDTSQQGASMGGRSSGGIAGIPTAIPATEPIFPVLSLNKEIWLPEDAAINANGGRLQLEITVKPKDVEVLDQPAPHPWIEAYLKYSPPQNIRKETKEYRKSSDAGQYAMIHVDLQSARLVNADTGATVLPLVLNSFP